MAEAEKGVATVPGLWRFSMMRLLLGGQLAGAAGGPGACAAGYRRWYWAAPNMTSQAALSVL